MRATDRPGTYRSPAVPEPELVQLIRENRAAELQRLAELSALQRQAEGPR